jgi:hypothetical protein
MAHDPWENCDDSLRTLHKEILEFSECCRPSENRAAVIRRIVAEVAICARRHGIPDAEVRPHVYLCSRRRLTNTLISPFVCVCVCVCVCVYRRISLDHRPSTWQAQRVTWISFFCHREGFWEILPRIYKSSRRTSDSCTTSQNPCAHDRLSRQKSSQAPLFQSSSVPQRYAKCQTGSGESFAACRQNMKGVQTLGACTHERNSTHAPHTTCDACDPKTPSTRGIAPVACCMRMHSFALTFLVSSVQR